MIDNCQLALDNGSFVATCCAMSSQNDEKSKKVALFWGQPFLCF